jgi:hypothetical protein
VNTERIKRTHHAGEVYPNVWGDFVWIGEHRQELLETYGEGVVLLVYKEEIVGKGKTIEEAVNDAEVKLPADVEQITPVTYFLTRPYRLNRKSVSKSNASS